MNETMQAILNRRSTRSYTAEPVTQEELNQILEAGLWAPTARNAQEIKIAVMTDPEQRAAFRQQFSAADGRPRFQNFDYAARCFCSSMVPRISPIRRWTAALWWKIWR